jgi:hypothetical protein
MAVLRLQKDIQSYEEQKIDFVRLSFPDPNSIQTINVAVAPRE